MDIETRRGMVVAFNETTARGEISLYGAGILPFHSTSFQSLPPTRFPKPGDVVEVSFQGDEMISVREVKKTMQDMLRPLTPRELDAVPSLTREEIQKALERGQEEMSRSRRARAKSPRQGRVEDPRRMALEIMELKQRVDLLELLLGLKIQAVSLPQGSGTTDGSTVHG